MSAVPEMPPVTLRPLMPGDVGRVMDIERRAYAFPWTAGIFRECLRAGYCAWAMELDERLVGYSIMSVFLDESHILNICIDPEYQGRGLGRQLLDHMLEVARRHGALNTFLEVRPSNRPAVRLYTRSGFVEIGVRRGYYPAARGREDALVLLRGL
ncbi:MAG TPA: ribosomal protein S18-alanine N-acetyltransferase [Gammaproteobacteria bacterium]|nr:ribosomal protein S18-alanine N-acetyltransferase [Gammaproteobacteria bacterium]